MISRLIFLSLLAWSLSIFALKQTDGFTIAKLGSVFIEDEGDFLDPALLYQTFSYLGKGAQSYVFLSEDGSYVIKFLRGSKRSQLDLRFPFLKGQLRERKILETEARMRQTLHSYAIARDLFGKESGIVATHLSASQTALPHIKILDRSNIEHSVDPNLYPFILQKRAILVKETIAQLMERGEVLAAKAALKSLFTLLKTRIDRGIEDGDPNLAKNFGFLNLEPVQIDGGSFQLEVSPTLARIQGSQEDLQHWINQCYPELSDDFKTAYEDFLAQVL